jgi:hypothetical protein
MCHLRLMAPDAYASEHFTIRVPEDYTNAAPLIVEARSFY